MRGARPAVGLECVEDVEEFDIEARCCAISVVEGERLRSCFVVGRRGKSISFSPDVEEVQEKGSRWRMGVRMARMTIARTVSPMRSP